MAASSLTLLKVGGAVLLPRTDSDNKPTIVIHTIRKLFSETIVKHVGHHAHWHRDIYAYNLLFCEPAIGATVSAIDVVWSWSLSWTATAASSLALLKVGNGGTVLLPRTDSDNKPTIVIHTKSKLFNETIVKQVGQHAHWHRDVYAFLRTCNGSDGFGNRCVVKVAVLVCTVCIVTSLCAAAQWIAKLQQITLYSM